MRLDRQSSGPSRSKGIGTVTLEAKLCVLGIDFIVVETPKKVAAIRREYGKRVIEQTRSGHPLSRAAISRVMKMLSERGRAAKKACGESKYTSAVLAVMPGGPHCRPQPRNTTYPTRAAALAYGRVLVAPGSEVLALQM